MMASAKPRLDDMSIDAVLKKLREEKPLVQCITNFVSMDIMANALLAIGASPAMVWHHETPIVLRRSCKATPKLLDILRRN